MTWEINVAIIKMRTPSVILNKEITGGEKMKITKLETFHVKPRWLFVKISTDEGICGWGEPVLEGKSTVVEEAVHILGDANSW